MKICIEKLYKKITSFREENCGLSTPLAIFPVSVLRDNK